MVGKRNILPCWELNPGRRASSLVTFVTVALRSDYVSVELCLLMGSLSSPQMIYESIWSGSGTKVMGKLKLGEEAVPVPFCQQQIPHGLHWARTWVSRVRNQWLQLYELCHGLLITILTEVSWLLFWSCLWWNNLYGRKTMCAEWEI